MSRLDDIEERLDASRLAASDQWEVDGLTTDGGYAVVAVDGMDVRTDGYLPEESAELFAHASRDLIDLVKFVRGVEELVFARESVGQPWTDPLNDLFYALGQYPQYPR